MSALAMSVVACHGSYSVVFCCFCCRSNKLQCPAQILLSGVSEPDVLTVQSVNLEHTCSVAKCYFTYPEVRKHISPEHQSTIATLMQFSVSASEIAMYLHDKGLTNVTQKDVANLRAKLRQSSTAEQKDEVSM